MTPPPPGSLGAPYVGKALKILADPFSFTLEQTRAHGSVWKTRILGETVVFFAGPEAFTFFMDPENFTRENGSPRFIQDLLHPDAVPFLDGPRHAMRKQLLLEAFRDDALATYLPGIFTIVERFTTRWATDSRGETAVASELVQLGFDIADHLFAASDPAVSNIEGAADFTTMNKGTFATPLNLPFTAYGRALRARDRLRTYIKQQVATRDGRGTALGVLKAARGPGGEALTAEELEIELLHFFFAAHGGLTAAFAWLLVVLGQHPELAATLRAEAEVALGDGAPTVDQARSLALANAVSREVLRAYPIAPITFFGVARRDLEIDGFSIRAGWKGAGAIWATLQDGTTFEDPSKFDVTRSYPERAFVPQGGGPAHGHRCAGEKLIQLLMPAFVGWFTCRYDVTLPAQDVSPGGGGLGPLPRDGLRVALSPRA